MAKKNINDDDLQDVAGGGQGTVDLEQVRKSGESPAGSGSTDGTGSGGNLMPANDSDFEADGRN